MLEKQHRGHLGVQPLEAPSIRVAEMEPGPRHRLGDSKLRGRCSSRPPWILGTGSGQWALRCWGLTIQGTLKNLEGMRTREEGSLPPRTEGPSAWQAQVQLQNRAQSTLSGCPEPSLPRTSRTQGLSAVPVSGFTNVLAVLALIPN